MTFKNRSRAFRRAQKQKFFEKTKKIIKNTWYFQEKTNEKIEKHAHLLEKNRKKCSCFMCSHEKTKKVYRWTHKKKKDDCNDLFSGD